MNIAKHTDRHPNRQHYIQPDIQWKYIYRQTNNIPSPDLPYLTALLSSVGSILSEVWRESQGGGFGALGLKTLSHKFSKISPV